MVLPIEEQGTISTLCVSLLRDCLDQFEGPDSLDDEELVHDLRVTTKRLRSAWHLVKEPSGNKLAGKRRKALRKLSAHLSFRRDLAVLEKLARNLASSQTDAEVALLLEEVGTSIRRQPTRSQSQPCPNGLFEEVRACLGDEIVAWNGIDWSGPKHTRKALRRSLHRATSETRGKTREALKDNSADIWHEWRKTIKRLRYQREFLARANGRRPGKFDARVSRLGTALGKRNDLANLVDYIEREVKSGKIEPGTLKKLRPLFGRVERDLLRNCRRLGRRLIQKN